MTKEEQIKELISSSKVFLAQLTLVEDSQKNKLETGVWTVYKKWVDEVREATAKLNSTLQNSFNES